MKSVLPVALAALLLSQAGPGRAQVADNAGNVRSATLTVRGPDGRPLRRHALRVFTADPGPPGYQVGIGTTDGLGQFIVTLPVGLHRLRVVAPSVGFGLTGIVAVGPGQVVTATLPPLARFAQLSGTVAAADRRPGLTVQLMDDHRDPNQKRPPVPVDTQGRFQFVGLTPGTVGLALGGASDQRPTAYSTYTLTPGEARTGIVLTLPATTSPPLHFETAAATRAVTLRGKVTDDQGNPVAGAVVYARPPAPRQSGFSNSLFGDQKPPLSTVTGADGAYVFPAVTIFQGDVTLPVAASAPGHPPAIVVAHVGGNADADVSADLVLPTRHTALTVRVTGPGGRPVGGAAVTLQPEDGIPDVVGAGAGAFPGFFAGFAAPFGPLHDLFAPSGKTGPDGVIRFVDLTPGLWDVTANTGGKPASALTGADAGISLQVGQVAACALVLAPRPPGPLARVLSPEGRPVPVQSVNADVGNTPSPYTGMTYLTDGPARDVAPPDFVLQAGLWRVGVTYREVPQTQPNWYFGDTEPFTEAAALVALSDALPPPGLLVLHAQRHGPGRLRVRLLGLDGKPAPGGTVLLPGFNDTPDYAATVDAHGEVVFADLPSGHEGVPDGHYTVQGVLAEPSVPPLTDQDAPPADAVLTAQPLVAPQSVAVTSDTETRFVLRAQRAGYLRLHLRDRTGTADDQVSTYVAGSRGDRVASHRDKAAGTFLVGPFPPGQISYSLYRFPPGGVYTPEGGGTAQVAAGKITEVALTPMPQAPPSVAPARPVTSLVFLHDGVTPAWGAAAVVRPSRYPLPFADARADALGRLQPGTLETLVLRSGQFPSPPPSGQAPQTPTWIVWLPGLSGAVLVPYVKGQDLRFTLPAPNVLAGRVTIGGQSADGRPGTIRVRAAYQGRGELNDLLSRDVTAQPDGTFTLPGLTAGTYLVQAARDGLWLSATQTVTVADDAEALPPLALDIAPPGAPVVLHLAPGEAVALDRPAGPLAETLWPATVRADGVGDLRLDGLEAGPHTVRPATGPPLAFTVPPVGSLPGDLAPQTR